MRNFDSRGKDLTKELLAKDTHAPKIGLILAGGGARAAYQVGVLKAIAALMPETQTNPFPIICGTSAGAINAGALAVYATRFQEGVRRLVAVWSNFRVHHVFRADPAGILSSAVRWYGALLLGGRGLGPAFLLDRGPLRELLKTYLPMEQIDKSIAAGALHALSITASNYSTGESITFFQGAATARPWKRVRRCGVPTALTIDHFMASSAIPFIFAAERIRDEYFGDGTMRQIAPISPALHLGAQRVLVIGVRQERPVVPAPSATENYPPLAQIAGHTLNSIFLDTLDADLERLERINHTIRLLPGKVLEEHGITLRPVDPLLISPSEDLGKIAGAHKYALPRSLRLLLRGIGAFERDNADLVSYLLFEKGYCRDLIDLGFSDTIRRQREVLDFLNFKPLVAATAQLAS